MYRCGQLVLGVLAVAAGLLYVKQESLLYFPTVGNIPKHNAQNPRGYRHPGERGLEYSSHIIASPTDGTLIHAWFIPHPSTTKKPTQMPTILFFHGNAGNIGLRIPNAVEMLRRVPAHLLLVEYRGYGDSPTETVPSEAGLKLDALAALEYARTELVRKEPERVSADHILAFGRSLGGAVAFFMAAHAEAQNQPLQGCIVENTFTSISDMVDQVLPFLSPIKRFVLRIGWDSLTLLKEGRIQNTPLLFLAGDADTLVPHAHMQQLKDAAYIAGMGQGLVPAWHVIRGGTHNECWVQGGSTYWHAIAEFVQRTAVTASSNGGTAPQSVNVDGNAAENEEMSSIPMMNNQFLGMAKDAWRNRNTTKDKST